MKYKFRNYKCKHCGHIKQIGTNHKGECYGQPLMRLNMCPNCSWKRPQEVVIWEYVGEIK